MDIKKNLEFSMKMKDEVSKPMNTVQGTFEKFEKTSKKTLDNAKKSISNITEEINDLKHQGSDTFQKETKESTNAVDDLSNTLDTQAGAFDSLKGMVKMAAARMAILGKNVSKVKVGVADLAGVLVAFGAFKYLIEFGASFDNLSASMQKNVQLTIKQEKYMKRSFLTNMLQLKMTEEQMKTMFGTYDNFIIKDKDTMNAFNKSVSYLNVTTTLGIESSSKLVKTFLKFYKGKGKLKEMSSMVYSVATATNMTVDEVASLVEEFKLLAKTSTKTVAHTMLKSILKIGGALNNAGIETSGLADMFKNLRMKYSAEGLTIKHMLSQNLGKPLSDINKLIEEGKYADYMTLLYKAVSGLSREQIERFGSSMQELYGVSYDVAIQLKTMSKVNFENIFKGFKKEADPTAIDKAWTKMQNRFESLTAQLKNAFIPIFKSLGTVFFEFLHSVLKKLVPYLEKTAKWLENLSTPFKYTISLMASLIVTTFALSTAFVILKKIGIGAVFKAMGSLIAGPFKFLMKGFGFLTKMILFKVIPAFYGLMISMLPFLIVMAKVALVGGAIYGTFKLINWVLKKFGIEVKWLNILIDSFETGLKNVGNNLLFFFKHPIDSVTLSLKTLWGWLNKIGNLWDSMKQTGGKGMKWLLEKTGLWGSEAKIVGAASGALVTAPQPMVVGENGPEVVMPVEDMGRLIKGMAPNAANDNKAPQVNVNLDLTIIGKKLDQMISLLKEDRGKEMKVENFLSSNLLSWSD